ncbi:hypothetical protein PE066_10605 [Ramlibacter tataouinensis]|uniref:hypothetical protein n=1 Tax=Ramlibacter tataouinensis TaxID=94132 RepID=UPI0022F3BEBD|nr:hypothetical protein [Ramlibacter tataouinensis]WBX99936.1 hypothetical protein PE066_10605 [Ramlibacter tataouinensis]
MTATKLLAGALLGLAACAAGAAAPPTVARMDSAALRKHYLQCSRESEQVRLGPPQAQFCAEVAQALLQRDFGGSLERQLAWWRQARQEPPPAAPGR